MTCIPLRQFHSLISETLHFITLWMVAFIQGADPASLAGLGISPSHVLSITALHVLTPSKKESKYLLCFEDSVSCPQIIKTIRE